MISLDAIEATANTLMAKAAIEIPDDYLLTAPLPTARMATSHPLCFMPCWKITLPPRKMVYAVIQAPRAGMKMGNERGLKACQSLEAALRRATA